MQFCRFPLNIWIVAGLMTNGTQAKSELQRSLRAFRCPMSANVLQEINDTPSTSSSPGKPQVFFAVWQIAATQAGIPGFDNS